MHEDPHHFHHSARDGSADDIHDLGHDDHDDFGGFSRSRRRSHHLDLSRAPLWVKAFVWAGALLAIAGFGVIIFSILGSAGARDPFPGPPNPALPAYTYTLPPGFPTSALPADLRPPAPPSPTRSSLGDPDLRLGFGLFFAGLVVSAIGGLGHSTSKRR